MWGLPGPGIKPVSPALAECFLKKPSRGSVILKKALSFLFLFFFDVYILIHSNMKSLKCSTLKNSYLYHKQKPRFLFKSLRTVFANVVWCPHFDF